MSAKEIRPASGKLGVLMPGMGAVATTFIAGVELARRGLGQQPLKDLWFLGIAGHAVVVVAVRGAVMPVWAAPGVTVVAVESAQQRRVSVPVPVQHGRQGVRHVRREATEAEDLEPDELQLGKGVQTEAHAQGQ